MLAIAKSGRLKLGNNIYGYYKSISTTVTYLASKAIEFGEKRKKGYYAVQGYSRSSRSVPIDFLLVINSNMTTYLVPCWVIAAYCSNLDVFRFWATLWGRGGWGTMCDVHVKLTGKRVMDNWTFLARRYGWGACTGENRSKIGDFAPTRLVWPTISGRRGRSPPIIFAWIVSLCQWMPYNFAADSFHIKKTL